MVPYVRPPYANQRRHRRPRPAVGGSCFSTWTTTRPKGTRPVAGAHRSLIIALQTCQAATYSRAPSRSYACARRGARPGAGGKRRGSRRRASSACLSHTGSPARGSRMLCWRRVSGGQGTPGCGDARTARVHAEDYAPQRGASSARSEAAVVPWDRSFAGPAAGKCS